jgi:hypothetical protein
MGVPPMSEPGIFGRILIFGHRGHGGGTESTEIGWLCELELDLSALCDEIGRLRRLIGKHGYLHRKEELEGTEKALGCSAEL